MKGKSCQGNILYPAKTSLKTKGKLKALRHIKADRIHLPTQWEILKDILQAERKWYQKYKGTKRPETETS